MAKDDNRKTIKLEPELMEQVRKYSKKVGTNPTALVRTLLTDLLEGKVLEASHIELDKPQYFNFIELEATGKVTCSTDKPSTELGSQMILKRVPNNLDSWNSIEGSYSYGNFSKNHKGICFSAYTEKEPYFLVFDYELTNSEGLFTTWKEPKITISIVKQEELKYYLDISEHKELIQELQNTVKAYNETVESFKETIEDKSIEELEQMYKEDTEYYRTKVHKIAVDSYSWFYYNYNLFIPISTYSKLNNLLFLYENATPEEVKLLEEKLFHTKEDLEELISSFNGANSRFNAMFFIILEGLSSAEIDLDSIYNNVLEDKPITEIIEGTKLLKM